MRTDDLYKLNINVHGGTHDVTALDTTMPDAPLDMVLMVAHLFETRMVEDMGDDVSTITHTLNTYDQSITVAVTLNSLMMEHGEGYESYVGANVSFVFLTVVHDMLQAFED